MAALSLPQLRPQSMGQIMDQAVRLYRRNFVAFVGIVALVQIPLIAAQFLITLTLINSDSGPDVIFGLFGLSTIPTFILTFILVQGVGTAAMTRAVSHNYLGEKTGSLQAFRKIGGSWLSLIGALIVAFLVIILLFIWALVPIVGWLTGWAMLGFFSVIILPLIAPVIILEGTGAAGAWRRAWDLARQRFWWMIGFFFVLSIFNWLVVVGPTLLLDYVFTITLVDSISNLTTAILIQSVITSLITLFFNLIYLPFQLAAITLVYLDLRVRTEAFDLILMSQDTRDSGLKAADVMAAAPQSKQQSLITLREFGYFAGATLLLGSLFFLLYLGLIFLILAIDFLG